MVYVDSVRKTTAKMRRREQWDRRRGERRSSGTGGSKGQSAGTRQVVPGRSRAQMGRASLELSPSVESCACDLGPSPVLTALPPLLLSSHAKISIFTIVWSNDDTDASQGTHRIFVNPEVSRK